MIHAVQRVSRASPGQILVRHTPQCLSGSTAPDCGCKQLAQGEWVFVMVCSLLEVACSDSQSVVQEAALRALRTMSTAQPLLRQVSARWAGKTGLLGELITSQQLVMSRRDVSKFPHFVQKSL